jgi:hypothetical protein
VHRGTRLTLVASGLVLAACSSGVDGTAPARATEPACAAAAGAWPAAPSGQQPVAVRTSSPSVRAWGDPAIIARCGVEPPAPTTLDCVEVDGIDWVAEPLSDGTRFTTFGRDPALEVLVPRHYAPEALLLPAFGPAAATLPTTGLRCS